MAYNPFSLENKTILVTGASSGIGRAIAIECSKMGATVILSGRNEQRLQETISQMQGKNHKIIVADLTKKEDRDLLIEQSPNLDGLVNNAGLIKTLPFQFIKYADLEEVMSVNFTAPTLISAALVKKKKLNKGSSVVFISSIAGLYGVTAANSMYAASKCAINGFAKNMALDLAGKNIRVNTVNPASVETHIYDEGIFTPEQLEEDTKRYPLKRYGKPEEVAYAAVYLLSDAAAWVTGTNLLIDGGYTLN
ncbi:MAG: SDR family oxidoreductase [Prevotellaceae bacterium]|jgi:NAD(P)-dependent dehydrogenase (short-subunit alcohol dehydrogenase family)|nr:SDR family oxidoreductase [Prevotellaceae bacterium]